jgi:ectoine hydroxylase-related dioxygenase (phytanoyl-CoA dioxygenase family)
MDYRKNTLGTLTHNQVAFYQSEGYLVLPNLLEKNDIAPAVDALSRKVSTIAEKLFAEGLISDKLEGWPFETRIAGLFSNLTDEHFLKYGLGWREREPGYFKLMSHPKILDAVESLIGGEIYSNPIFNVRPKVPKVAAGEVPWHQDKSYWPGSDSNPVITVWIPFVDADQENGCLHILPRTHRKELLPFHREKETGANYTKIDKEQMSEDGVVALPLSAGGAIFFNDRCIHMSTANRSNHVRWSMDIRYQPADQDKMLDKGAGFLARSRKHPHLVATLDDWLEGKTEHEPPVGFLSALKNHPIVQNLFKL